MKGQLPQCSSVSIISPTLVIITEGDTLSLPRGCLELLVAVLPQLNDSLFESESCKWKTGLEEGKAQIHDNIIYAPGSSHAKSFQLCERVKSLCWLMTVQIRFISFLTKKFLSYAYLQTANSETRICLKIVTF